MSDAKNNTATATTGIAEAAQARRGRFAPTPSGPLHLGSLLAALGSFLQVRSQDGEWWVRIEDLDRNRTLPGTADEILRTLEAFGFEWHGTVEFQSLRTDQYQQALDQLRLTETIYACRCSRAQLATLPRDSQGEFIYPGTCRNDPTAAQDDHALRLRILPETAPVTIEDLWQGNFVQDLARDVGDFIIRRRDGFFAYHLAVVVDDAAQGMSEVVRGSDLLDCTPRQVLLQRILGLATPNYGHLPLLLEPDGQKLAKSRRSIALDPALAGAQLHQCLIWLGQEPPAELCQAPAAEVLAWGLAHWRPGALSGRRQQYLMEPAASGR